MCGSIFLLYFTRKSSSETTDWRSSSVIANYTEILKYTYWRWTFRGTSFLYTERNTSTYKSSIEHRDDTENLLAQNTKTLWYSLQCFLQKPINDGLICDTNPRFWNLFLNTLHQQQTNFSWNGCVLNLLLTVA